MSGPIYNLFFVHSYREAYFQLSPEEREQFWVKVGKNSEEAGSQYGILCNSRWCNETILAWGVEEYPDLASLQRKVARADEEYQHYRYIEAESILGIKTDDSPIPSSFDFPNPIFQLWMVKNQNNEPWESLSKEQQDHYWTQVGGSIEKHGGVGVIVCDTYWSNEEVRTFGVTAWPNIEAEQAHFKVLADIGWHRYFYSKTILGSTLS